MSIDGLRSGLRATGFERLEVSNTILMGVTSVWKRQNVRSKPASIMRIERAWYCSAAEEEILASIFLRLRQQFPSLRLFIAPRHVERLREIRAQFGALPMRVALASEVAIGRESDADCIVLDTTGDLHRWYAIATIVFMGKSLTAHGGQNPVEPIIAGKPVVFGPHMENFATLAKALVLKKGAIQVPDMDSLELTIVELLRDSEACQRLVQMAREVLSEHQGATARAAALIHELNPSL